MGFGINDWDVTIGPTVINQAAVEKQEYWDRLRRLEDYARQKKHDEHGNIYVTKPEIMRTLGIEGEEYRNFVGEAKRKMDLKRKGRSRFWIVTELSDQLDEAYVQPLASGAEIMHTLYGHTDVQAGDALTIKRLGMLDKAEPGDPVFGVVKAIETIDNSGGVINNVQIILN